MNIKFVNGSEIQSFTTKEKHKEAPMMFYSVDLAKKDSKDMTCIAYRCSHCNTVFHIDYYDKEDADLTEFQTCTNCGVRFRGWYQL